MGGAESQSQSVELVPWCAMSRRDAEPNSRISKPETMDPRRILAFDLEQYACNPIFLPVECGGAF